MARWRWLLAGLGLLLAGCKSDRTTPVWAIDPIYLEPTETGVYGLQSWELFAERWTRSYRRKFYLCGVVVELAGVPASGDCEACEQIWAVSTSFVESDCEGDVAEDERFLALSSLALGPVDASLSSDEPYPGESTGVLADYGGGLEDYGWGYPEALDGSGEASGSGWDGEQAFQLAPSYVWELDTE